MRYLAIKHKIVGFGVLAFQTFFFKNKYSSFCSKFGNSLVKPFFQGWGMLSTDHALLEVLFLCCHRNMTCWR